MLQQWEESVTVSIDKQKYRCYQLHKNAIQHSYVKVNAISKLHYLR